MGPGHSGLVDAHLHLQDERLDPHRNEIIEILRREDVVWWGVNGTYPDDWERVADLARSFSEVYPFFGVHPWKVEAVEDAWEKKLIGFLERFPRAGVGEIGLDRWIRNHDIERQKEILVRQLQLALNYQRPIAIHCLQAWGHLLDVLEKQRWDRPFLLHSYSGPVEMVSQFLDQGAFFSISGYFFRDDKREKLEVFRSVPPERILLETDAPDMLPPGRMRRFPRSGTLGPDSDPLNHPANLVEIYESFTSWSGVPRNEVIQVMEENCRRWIAGSLKPGPEEPGRP